MSIGKRFATVLDEQTELVANMTVGDLWDRMLREFLGEWERLWQNRVPEAEMDRQLQAFMDDLSDNPEALLARGSSNAAYQQGRGAAALDARSKGEARFVVRSEILDQSTCGPCERLDSTVYEIGTSEYYANQPPAYCEGGRRCRGFYVVVPNDLGRG